MLVRDAPSELNTPAVVPVGGASGEEVRTEASAGLSDAGLLFGRDAFFFCFLPPPSLSATLERCCAREPLTSVTSFGQSAFPVEITTCRELLRWSLVHKDGTHLSMVGLHRTSHV